MESEYDSAKEKDRNIAATLMSEAVAQHDAIRDDFLADWRDIKRTTIMFIDEKPVSHLLAAMDMLSNYGLQPYQCDPFMQYYWRIYDSQKQLRTQYGHSGLSVAGLICGKPDITYDGIWTYADDILMQGFKGGKDLVWLGNRELGKSDACLHYCAVPWLKSGKNVVSGIKIDNRSDWPRYHYCTTDGDLLMKSCDIIVEALKRQEDKKKDEIVMPPIFLIRDDIAASGVSRKRATSGDLFNLECLGMVARHFSLGTGWIFQYWSSVPSSIREFSTRIFKKLSKKKLHSTIYHGSGVQVKYIDGLKGLAERKEIAEKNLERPNYPYKNGEFLDYYTQRPQITAMNLDMSEVLQYVNFKEREAEQKGGLTQLELFTTVRDYLKEIQQSPAHRVMTKESILNTLSMIYIQGKEVKKMKYINLTYNALSSLFVDWGISDQTLGIAIREIKTDMKRNPDKWEPTLETKKERDEFISELV